MVIRSAAALMAVLLLGGCSAAERSPQRVAVAAASPPAESYVWARNDGRRMSADPGLLAKGRADQERCRLSATAAGGLDQRAFISCMEASGYSRRNA